MLLYRHLIDLYIYWIQLKDKFIKILKLLLFYLKRILLENYELIFIVTTAYEIGTINMNIYKINNPVLRMK